MNDLENQTAALRAILMRIKAKRTLLGSLGRRNTVSRSHVRLIHPPYNWADEDFERWIREREARDDLENAIQEERERREDREATWPWCGHRLQTLRRRWSRALRGDNN